MRLFRENSALMKGVRTNEGRVSITNFREGNTSIANRSALTNGSNVRPHGHQSYDNMTPVYIRPDIKRFQGIGIRTNGLFAGRLIRWTLRVRGLRILAMGVRNLCNSCVMFCEKYRSLFWKNVFVSDCIAHPAPNSAT